MQPYRELIRSATLDKDGIAKAFVKTGTETSGYLDELVALNRRSKRCRS